LVRKLSDGPAGPQWEVEGEVDGQRVRWPLAEQALTRTPPEE
jgi:hypothetical protein